MRTTQLSTEQATTKCYRGDVIPKVGSSDLNSAESVCGCAARSWLITVLLLSACSWSKNRLDTHPPSPNSPRGPERGPERSGPGHVTSAPRSIRPC